LRCRGFLVLLFILFSLFLQRQKAWIRFSISILAISTPLFSSFHLFDNFKYNRKDVLFAVVISTAKQAERSRT